MPSQSSGLFSERRELMGMSGVGKKKIVATKVTIAYYYALEGGRAVCAHIADKLNGYDKPQVAEKDMKEKEKMVMYDAVTGRGAYRQLMECMTVTGVPKKQFEAEMARLAGLEATIPFPVNSRNGIL